MQFVVYFDNTVLTLKEIDKSSAMVDIYLPSVDVVNSTGKISFAYVNDALINNVGDGNFATLIFDVAEGAEIGVTPITVTYEDGESFYYDEDYNTIDLPLSKEEGAVEIIDYLYGDADGNGDVNVRDAAMIIQYLADWDVDINLDAADVDLDGKVGIRDAARILQYISGWDVTLG